MAAFPHFRTTVSALALSACSALMPAHRQESYDGLSYAELDRGSFHIEFYASYRSTEFIPATLASWRDVFVLDEANTKLEKTLDRLFEHPEAQQMLKGFNARKMAEARVILNKTEHPVDKEQLHYAEENSAWKIRIVTSDHPFVVSHVIPGKLFPEVTGDIISVVIGSDISHTEYLGKDGKYHHFSTEGVLAHELFGHVLSSNRHEQHAVELGEHFMHLAGYTEAARAHYSELREYPGSRECTTPDPVEAKQYMLQQILEKRIAQRLIPPLPDIEATAQRRFELCGKPEVVKKTGR